MNKKIKLLKSILSFIGKLLGAFGLIFVIYKLSQEYTVDTFFEKLNALKYALVYLLGINFISLLLGVYAWHIMLLNYAVEPFAYINSYYYFAKTEIAKYLPGNVFHFVGRQILANKIGITQQEMVKISLLFSFLLLTGTIISSTFFSLFADSTVNYILISMVLSCIGIIMVTLFLYPSFSIKKKAYMSMILTISVALQGIMLGLIVMLQIGDFTTGLFFQSVSIYIISWLIGFVTPGASGGLGVREGTFVAIATYLHVNIPADIIIFSVLLVRLINISVDIIAYLSTFILKTKIKGFET
jgi:hypothetical protein